MKNETSFSRLPGNVINNELYIVQKNLRDFLICQRNGNDVNLKDLNKIIKDLQDIKKEVKEFNESDEVSVKYLYKA